jgi:hypothetical protein
MKATIKFIAIAVLFTGFISCKKDTKEPEPNPEPTPVATTGTLKIQFDHLVGTTPLVLNQNYLNPKLDTFKVSKLKYYISNIVITKNDNSTFVEPESYYLLDASNPLSTVLTLTNVPFASYKSISFMLGVDSARSASGAQTGALSQSNGMYWMWASGYIMFKLEGTSPQSGASNKSLVYHIGGYSGVNKTQRNYNLNFGSPTANVSSGTTPKVHLSVDINEFFKNPILIDVATQYFQMATNANAKMYADNFADMIKFEHVHND